MLAVYMVLSLGRIQNSLSSIKGELTPRRLIAEIAMEPTKVTRTKTVDNTEHSVTWCYDPGGSETWAEFLERVNREWAAYCQSIGE